MLFTSTSKLRTPTKDFEEFSKDEPTNDCVFIKSLVVIEEPIGKSYTHSLKTNSTLMI